MRAFSYVIADRAGIHARPAGMVVKEAKKYDAEITIKKGDVRADAKNLMKVMALGAKCGQEIEVEISGPDEEVAYAAVETILKEHL